MSSLLVFKGGNALDFIWQANRSTRDLDFSIDSAVSLGAFSPDELRARLTTALDATTRVLGIAFRVQRMDRQPPGAERTFVTYDVSVGYALPDEEALRKRFDEGRPSPNVVPIEISLNEPICAAGLVSIDPTHRLRVSTLEDIVAEKLRALLQQSIRNRTRRQDLLDIAVVLQTHRALDRAAIARFLLEKARARSVPVSRAAFHSPELASRAAQDYDALRATTRVLFIPFDEALQALYDFVDRLEIPNA